MAAADLNALASLPGVNRVRASKLKAVCEAQVATAVRRPPSAARRPPKPTPTLRWTYHHNRHGGALASQQPMPRSWGSANLDPHRPSWCVRVFLFFCWGVQAAEDAAAASWARAREAETARRAAKAAKAIRVAEAAAMGGEDPLLAARAREAAEAAAMGAEDPLLAARAREAAEVAAMGAAEAAQRALAREKAAAAAEAERRAALVRGKVCVYMCV